MNRKKLCLLLTLLFVGTLLFASGSKESSSFYRVSGNKKTLTVELPSNPTTGFQWEVSIEGGTVFEKVSDSYKQNKASKNMVGVGGVYTALFKTPFEDGTFLIHFRYRRSWEDVPAIEEKTLKVVIENKKMIEVSEV